MVITGNGPTSSCQALPSAQPCVAVVPKISKSRKRKQRMRRVAVRHAIKASGDLQTTLKQADMDVNVAIALEQACDVTYPNINHELVNTVQRLEQKLDIVHNLLGNICNYGQAGVLSEGLIPESSACQWSLLNANAAPFVPHCLETVLHDLAQEAEDQTHTGPSAELAPRGLVNLQSNGERFGTLPSVATWLQLPPCLQIAGPVPELMTETEDMVEENVHVPVGPVLTHVPGSSAFTAGDNVLVVDGPWQGRMGVIKKPGGQFTVSENGTTSTFEALCSVDLHDVPNGIGASVFREEQLEFYECEARSRLKSAVEKCVRAMEMNLIPDRCHEMLAPLIRKGLDAVESAPLRHCEQIEEILAKRLDQISDEIFGHLSRDTLPAGSV